MSLAEQWDRANDSLARRTCKTCDWYRGLAVEDQDFFDAKVAEALSGRGQMQRLRRAILASGHQVARSTFHGHIHEHHSRLVAERRHQEAP